ncbi:MAG: hypothetical protein EP343_14450 [Deltaproteobacteria bacterium]|nr:MAG: hypothetical protein EP343_14450 [Deltaproteobacteria bacterium]
MSEFQARPTGPQIQGTQLLSESFSTFLSNLPAFLTINLICLSPAAFAYLYMMNSATTQREVLTATLVFAGAEIFLALIARGAMVYGTVQYMAGHEVSIGDCLARGMRMLVMVIGVSIVSGLLIFGGALLLIIPGILMALSLYVAIPVAVTENLGVMDSIRRSREMMYGSRAQVFVALFIVTFIQNFVNRGVDMAIAGQGLMIIAGARIAISVVFTSVSSIMASVAYVQLREAVDDIDAEELSKVFD